MPVRVVHFGVDRCKRLPVLRSAGYAIDECPTMSRLALAVRLAQPPGAILLSEGEGQWRRAATLIRSRACHSPLILFQESPSRELGENELDLVIPPFTSPRAWLASITSTIERSCGVRANSEALQAESEILLQECQRIMQKLREGADRTKFEIARWQRLSGSSDSQGG